MSDCGVCLSGHDMDVPFFFERQRKARKSHRCSECGRTIEPTMKYHQVGGICEGKWWSQSVCSLCYEITNVFHCDNNVQYGNLWDDMRDAIFPDLTINNPCIHKLSNEARAFLTDQWWKWKEANG